MYAWSYKYTARAVFGKNQEWECYAHQEIAFAKMFLKIMLRNKEYLISFRLCVAPGAKDKFVSIALLHKVCYPTQF